MTARLSRLPTWLITVTAAVTAWLGGGWKAACISRQELVFATGCYSDVPPLYVVRGLAEGARPYFDSYHGNHFEYPVLTGAYAWLTAQLAHLLPAEQADRRLMTFAALTWLGLAALSGLTGWLLTRLAGPATGWAFALSPVLLANVGINWDMLAVAPAVGALLAWQRRRPALAGLLIGVGAAAKLWPALLLAALLLDAGTRRDLRAAARAAATAAGSWLVLNVPVALLAWDGWYMFYRFSRERPVDLGSLGYAWQILTGATVPTAAVNLAGTVGMAGLLTVMALAQRRRAAPVAVLAFTLLTGFTVLGKVYSPQYALWLLPFVILAVADRRMVTAWTAMQILYFLGVWAHLNHSGVGLAIPASSYAILIVLTHLTSVLATVSALAQRQRR